MESVLAPIKAGWKLWKKHIIYTWIVFGIIWGVSLFFGLIESQFPEESFPRLLVSLLSFFVMFFLQLGSIHIFLQLVRSGQELSYEQLFSQREVYWRALGGNILYYLAVFIGLILLIIPGIYIALRYFFLNYVFVDQKLSIKETFRESERLTDGHKWQLLGFAIVLGLVNLLGALALLIGLVVTIPVTALATVLVYESLRKAKSEAAVPVEVDVEKEVVPAAAETPHSVG